MRLPDTAWAWAGVVIGFAGLMLIVLGATVAIVKASREAREAGSSSDEALSASAVLGAHFLALRPWIATAVAGAVLSSAASVWMIFVS